MRRSTTTGLRKAVAAALVVLGLGLAAPARAMPLTDLLGGGGFDSGNGELTFDNFSADVEIDGLLFGEEFFEDLILGFSHVFQLDDGLAVFSPVIAIGIFSHVEVALDLSFDVWAAGGREIVAASVSFLGFELGAAEASVMSSFFDDDELLETISLGAAGFGFTSDSVIFDGGYEHLSVEDLLSAESCGCGIAKALKVVHHFDTQPVPETSILLLGGSGLLGLWGVGRRRQNA